MRNKRLIEKASVLNRASAHSGKPFVLAFTKPELKPVELSSFGCSACKFEFASHKGAEPFCINCGSDAVTPSKQKAAALPKTDAELAAIVCKSCDTNNVVTESMAANLDGQMHCVSCGTGLSFGDPEAVKEAEQEGAAEAFPGAAPPFTGDQAQDQQAQAEQQQQMQQQQQADAPAAVNPAAMPAETLPSAPAPVPLVAPQAEQQMSGEDCDQQQQQDDLPMVQALQDDDLLQHAAAEDDEQDEQEQDQEQQQAFVQASLVAVVLASNPKAELSLAVLDEQLLAFADGVNVAVLERANAGDNANVFHSKSFSQAIIMAAQTDGLASALASYKFTPVNVQFPQKAAVRASVALRVTAAAKAYEEKAAEHSKDFMQCLQMAAVALTKGRYKKKDNALKSGFVNLLTTAGVQDAAKVVNRVFAMHGDQYHSDLFAMASSFMEKSLSLRNELAEELSEMNVSDEIRPEDEQQLNLEHADLGARMENASVRPVGPKQPVTAATRSGEVASIQSLRQLAGGKLFN